MPVGCIWGEEVKLNVITKIGTVTVSGNDYINVAQELGFNLDTGAYSYRYMQTLILNGNAQPIDDKKLFKYNPETGIVAMPTFSDIKRYASGIGVDIDNTAEFVVRLFFTTANASEVYEPYMVEIVASIDGNSGVLPGGEPPMSGN